MECEPEQMQGAPSAAPEPPRPPSISKKKISLTLVVPTDVVGLLIGKHGATLREISAGSGAKLSFQAFSDMPPGTKERCVVIWGNVDAIVKAEAIILNKMEIRRPKSDGDEVVIDDGKFLLKWLIPNSMCGLLIGKHGEGIKQINEASGAWVKVAHEQESAPGSTERMVYITGSKEQNASALKLVIDKVAGRPFTGDSKGELMDPLTEECLYLPATAVSSILTAEPQNPELHQLLELHSISFRILACNAETGLTTVRVILKGSESGRAAVRAYISKVSSKWRSASAMGSDSSGSRDDEDAGALDAQSQISTVTVKSKSLLLETSVKMTLPRDMLVDILGDGDAVVKELMKQSNAMISITAQNSPSVEIHLAVVVLAGQTESILKAQELLLLRTLQLKLTMPRFPVQLSNQINAAGGGISSSDPQGGMQPLNQAEMYSQKIQQIERQLHLLHMSQAHGVGDRSPPSPYYESQAHPHGGYATVSSPIMYNPYHSHSPVFGGTSGYNHSPNFVGAGGVPMYMQPGNHMHMPAHQLVYIETPMGLQPVMCPVSPPTYSLVQGNPSDRRHQLLASPHPPRAVPIYKDGRNGGVSPDHKVYNKSYSKQHFGEQSEGGVGKAPSSFKPRGIGNDERRPFPQFFAQNGAVNHVPTAYSRPAYAEDPGYRYHNSPQPPTMVLVSPNNSPLGTYSSPTLTNYDEYSSFQERSVYALTDSPDSSMSYGGFGYGTPHSPPNAAGISPITSLPSSKEGRSAIPPMIPTSNHAQWAISHAKPGQRRKVSTLSKNISKGLKGLQNEK